MKIEATYDKRADLVYLSFSGERVAFSRKLDSERIVDYSQDGEIRGIQFLAASSGLNTEDLPHKSAIERALRDSGFVKRASGHSAGRPSAEFRTGVGSGDAPHGARAKASISVFLRAIAAILVFIAGTTASVALARNLFILSSLPGFLASILGLVIALLPTVLGCLLLLAWALDVRINVAVRRNTPPAQGRRSPTKDEDSYGVHQ